MTNILYDHDVGQRRHGSLLVTFRKPAGRLVTSEQLCDESGTVIDLVVNGVREFCEESPMIEQPDLLVDKFHTRVVGLTFELTEPEWMIPRCRRMLHNLDSRVIRLSDRTQDGYIGLEVLWAQSRIYERVFAHLSFGLWGFLYSTADPSFLDNSDEWTPPDGLVIADLRQLGRDVEVAAGDYECVVAQKASGKSD